MACQFGVISRTKTQGKEPGQVVGSTGSMWYTSDDRSDMVAGHRTKKVRPRSCPGAGNTGCEVGSTRNPNEGADVAKSTRGVPRSDSRARNSAVKITPVSSVPATVPSIPAVA